MSPVELDAPLDPAQLRAAFVDQFIGHHIVVLEATTSTNDVVAEMAASNHEGLVVFAEAQTAARGQYGRRWESPARKGLWLSLLLRPKIAVGDSALLTDLLARAVAVTIKEQTELNCSIKAPNDVYLAAQKIAGVLVEMRVEPSGDYAAIAGIGLNVNQAREDFPPGLRETAGSLFIAGGHPVDRTTLAIALLQNLNSRYARMRRDLCA